MNALAYLDSLQGSGIRPGLGRMRALLRRLRNPHQAYPSVIVAGTNGKGSTAATLESILRHSGLRTALYTSPHLVDVRERWLIAGEMIAPELLEESVARLRDAAKAIGIHPTYFEAMTIVAFIAFSIAECEVAVLEVGMGGRLDATNVVRPLAAVITPIGLDHTEYLGRTVRQIAAEKAGVIHRGAVVLTSNEDPRVLEVLWKRAAKFDNRFLVVREDHDTPLAGDYQRRNAALAVWTARELAAHFPAITEAAIETGVAATRWRGRLERMHVRGKDIWIDGGHNAHAAAAIAPFIERAVPRPRLLVFGIMSDKDIPAVEEQLYPLFDRILTTEPFPPRSAKAEALATAGNAEAIPDPEAALARALAAPEPSVVVAGSLYLAGAAIAFFDKIARS